MEYDKIVEAITTGAERWKSLKGQQYKLKFPDGVYSSELMNCALLSGVPCEENTLGERVVKAAEMLASLKKDERVSKYLALSSDVPAILALAALAERDVPAIEHEKVQVPQLGSEEDVDIEVTLAEAPMPLGDIRETERALETVPCPACGFGSPDYVRPEISSVVPEPTLASVQSAMGESPASALDEPHPQEGEAEFAPRCSHVAKDGCCAKCTDEPVVECSGCEEDVVAASGERCMDFDADGCDIIFCADCSREGLSQFGYCEGCASLECDCCGSSYDNGTGKACKGEDCNYGCCLTCAPDLFNRKGLCPECSGEGERLCDACDGAFITSKLTSCVEDDCELDFCSKCLEGRLDSNQRCRECAQEYQALRV